jgi:hypothetical protein
MRQSWEPRERHRDRPAIREFRDQRIVAHAYALRQCFPEFSAQNTHAMTSPRKPRTQNDWQTIPVYRNSSTQNDLPPHASEVDSHLDVGDRRMQQKG